METTGGPTQGSGGSGPDLTAEMVQECRDEVSAAAVDLHMQEGELERAIGRFPEGFALDDWMAAHASESPEERPKVSQVMWPFVTIVNDLNTIVMNGTVVTGLMSRARLKHGVPDHYRALESAGVVTEAEREDLEKLNSVRVGATHWYGRTTPEQLHEGIELLRKTVLAPPMRDKLETWIADEVLKGGTTESPG